MFIFLTILLHNFLYYPYESFCVKFALVVSAVSWVGSPLVVIIVNMLVLYYPWELGPLQITPRQQTYILQLLHPLNQLG